MKDGRWTVVDRTLVYVPELSLESRLVWYSRQGGSRPLDTGSRPIWTADGRSVTFQMGGNLYSVPADDSGQPQLVLEREARFSRLFPLAWSRNGRVLMFSAPAPATNRDVWMLPSESAMTPFLVTPRDERAAMFSPDGRWVVYAVRETGREEQVYVQQYPGSGGRELISPDSGIEPVWSPTGREIFYRSSDGTRIMSVEVHTEPIMTIGDSRVLFAGKFMTSEGSYWSNDDVSPDGQEFVMLEGDQASTSQLNVVLPAPRHATSAFGSSER